MQTRDAEELFESHSIQNEWDLYFLLYKVCLAESSYMCDYSWLNLNPLFMTQFAQKHKQI